MQGNLEISGGSSSGGSTSPGGSDTQLQFNDGGSFGGDAGLTYDKTANTLTITGGTDSTGARSLVVSRDWDTNASFIEGTDLRFTTSGTANFGTVEAMYNRLIHGSTGTIDAAYGFYSDVRRGTGAGAVTNLIGGNAFAFTIGNGGNVTNAYGLYGEVIASGGTGYTITNSIGLASVIANYSAGATMTDVYGVYVATDSLDTDTTNTYGVYIDSLQGTNQWAFYNSQSQALVYTAGDLSVAGDLFFSGLPTSDPLAANQVWSDSGTLKLSGATSSSAFGIDRVVETGTTVTVADTYSVVVSDYFAVEGTGTLIIEGDGDLAVI